SSAAPDRGAASCDAPARPRSREAGAMKAA
ncbi:transcriptional regulator, partial [Burkholderia thailandensis]|nr:transcriptional regulator [Burkholderia thailandensis]